MFTIGFTLLQVGTASYSIVKQCCQDSPILVWVSQFFELVSHLIYSNHKSTQSIFEHEYLLE